jgi:hypothetical protein
VKKTLVARLSKNNVKNHSLFSPLCYSPILRFAAVLLVTLALCGGCATNRSAPDTQGINVFSDKVTPDDIIASIRSGRDTFDDGMAYKTMNECKPFALTLQNIFKDARASDYQKCAAAYFLGEMPAPASIDDLVSNITVHMNPAAYPRFPTRIQPLEDDRTWPSVTGALVKIGAPAIPALIRNLQESDDTNVTAASLTVLYSIEGDKDIVQSRLQKALDVQPDAAKKARLQAAIKFLPEIKIQPDNAPPALDMEMDFPPSEKISSDDVIASIRAGNFDDFDRLAVNVKKERSRFVGTLLDMFRDARASNEQKCAAAYYLGKMHAPEAVDDLATNITLRIDPMDVIQFHLTAIWPSATGALVAIGTPAIPAVIKILQESDDANVVESSLAILINIENNKDIVQLRLQKALDAQPDAVKKARLLAAINSLLEIKILSANFAPMANKPDAFLSSPVNLLFTWPKQNVLNESQPVNPSPPKISVPPQQYEVDGEIEQTIYNRNGSVGALEKSQFTVFVKDSSWLIHCYILDKVGKPVSVAEIACTNGEEIYSVGGRINNDNGSHAVRSWNTAYIDRNNIPVGEDEGYYACHLWQMFASGGYFAHLSTDRLTPAYDSNASVAVDTTLKRQAKWQLIDGPGSLPLKITYWRPPDEGGDIDATYVATGVTNAGGIQVPNGFVFERRIGGHFSPYFAPGPIALGETLPDYRIYKRAVAIVTAVRPYCSRSNLMPTAEGMTMVIDQRLVRAENMNEEMFYNFTNGVQWLSVWDARRMDTLQKKGRKK